MFQSSHRVSDMDQRPRTTGKADNQPRFAHSLGAFSGVRFLWPHYPSDAPRYSFDTSIIIPDEAESQRKIEKELGPQPVPYTCTSTALAICDVLQRQTPFAL